MESILTLDRLRQNVAVKELETAHGQPLSMRKTVSVPNFSQVSSTFTTTSAKRIECFYIKITMLCPVPYFQITICIFQKPLCFFHFFQPTFFLF